MSKERPILFNAEMVNAILDGRKTQTRRVMQQQPPSDDWTLTYVVASTEKKLEGKRHWVRLNEAQTTELERGPYFNKPYEIGDHLWVRETCIISPKNWLSSDDQLNHKDIVKDSDGNHRVVQYLATNSDTDVPLNDYKLKKTPSIHMPRWASRILLKVTDVRKERLNDISEADVIAEGGPKSHSSIDKVSRTCGFKDWSRSWFAHTWDWINGNGAWSQNPWVWVVEFKVVEGATQ
ncbi:hypothetical protein LVY74_16640 [Acinetobacter sp. ME22]|uniref:hypothetical protein n=1 Tax=Acinetobacter sp. ME22 TaxID=2904802 RepID=UPI001ED9CA7A|nr:hypothetical protein [Acinetobacter sp. ME22]MCG2575166.1 hypothetical protein [Acinetobacter sp. ME22]